MSPPALVLASRSPARLGLLRAAGIDPVVDVSGVDEGGLDPAAPVAMAAGLARRKAETVAARRPGVLVLGCDSVLDLDGRAHGKPVDSLDAVTRWKAMRGRSGVLHTGHCLIDDGRYPTGGGRRRVEEVASTGVRFADVSDREIDAYVATGEPLEVAGAFTLDGRAAPFVEGIDGDPSNVIGLSLPLLRRLLADLGVGITDLWSVHP